jgi:hypothetical protein
MLYVHQIILGLEKYDLLQEEKKKPRLSSSIH